MAGFADRSSADESVRLPRRSLIVGTAAAALLGWADRASAATPPAAPAALPSRSDIVAEFADRQPTSFGMFLDGVISHGRRSIALTFDACGGLTTGNGYDAHLIRLLVRYRVPATLFLNARWITANRAAAADLAANPLFELANHGHSHRPLTVAGQSAYRIVGSGTPGEAYDEIVRGMDTLAEITGTRSPYFRPGTAWCDDVGVEIAHRLGVRMVAFSINADAGARAPAKTVSANLQRARQTSITIGHFNHPERWTAEGLARALPRMRDAGRRFTTLSRALA